MDSITQAALGAVVGELVLGRKIGWKGAAWGFLFGTLPDLDILAYPWLTEIERLSWHRGISHSILAMFAAALLFAWPLAWLHRRKAVTPREAGWFVFLAWSTHVLIDCFTSYGTQIFEPFSSTRVSLNNLFIIDPLFTLPLLIGTLLCFFFAIDSPRRRRINQLALALPTLYVLLSFGMKAWATHHLRSNVATTLPNAKFIASSTTPLNILLWRGLFETDGTFHVTYWSPFDNSPSQIDSFPRMTHLATPHANDPWISGLNWFARDCGLYRPASDGSLLFIDMRFGELRTPSKTSTTPVFRWNLAPTPEGSLDVIQQSPRDANIKEALKLLKSRILGKTEIWDSKTPF